MDWFVVQKPLPIDTSSDRDLISDMNIADDTLESMDSSVIQGAESGEGMDDSFQTGEIMPEISLSTIRHQYINS